MTTTEETNSSLVSECSEILDHLIENTNSKLFLTEIASDDPIFIEFNVLTTDLTIDHITFATIEHKLLTDPCPYLSFTDFTKDIKLIFSQTEIFLNSINEYAKERVRAANALKNIYSNFEAAYVQKHEKEENEENENISMMENDENESEMKENDNMSMVEINSNSVSENADMNKNKKKMSKKKRTEKKSIGKKRSRRSFMEERTVSSNVPSPMTPKKKQKISINDEEDEKEKEENQSSILQTPTFFKWKIWQSAKRNIMSLVGNDVKSDEEEEEVNNKYEIKVSSPLFPSKEMRNDIYISPMNNLRNTGDRRLNRSPIIGGGLECQLLADGNPVVRRVKTYCVKWRDDKDDYKILHHQNCSALSMTEAMVSIANLKTGIKIVSVDMLRNE